MENLSPITWLRARIWWKELITFMWHLHPQVLSVAVVPCHLQFRTTICSNSQMLCRSLMSLFSIQQGQATSRIWICKLVCIKWGLHANTSSYVSSVDLGISPPTDAQLAEIERRQTAYATASGNFWTQQSVAYTRYLNDPFAQATKQAFSAWVTQNDALFISYQNAMKNAAGKSLAAT